MAGKDKKSKAAEKRARVVAKQSKKSAKSDKKAKTKGSREDDSDAEDVDLDAVLAAYAEQQAQFLKVTEATCDPPSPRSSSTLIASPSNRNELLLFGGEYYDGTLATFFNNLYIHLIDRGEWREVTSPNSPLPRSGHACCRGGNAGGIYLFGGEAIRAWLTGFAYQSDLACKGRRILFTQTRYILSLQRLLASRPIDKRVEPVRNQRQRSACAQWASDDILQSRDIFPPVRQACANKHARTTFCSLVASRTHRNRLSIFKIYGYTIAKISFGTIQLYLQPLKSPMHDPLFPFFRTTRAPCCTVGTHVSRP